MRREENWNHLNVKRSLKAYDTQMARVNRNLGTSLEDEQHTALMVLTQYRHNLHKARETYGAQDADIKNSLRNFFLNQMSILLRTAKLPELNIRYFLVDHIEDENARTAYIDELNDEIESYLHNIDKTYGTMYCPTGFRRKRRESLHAAMEM